MKGCRNLSDKEFQSIMDYFEQRGRLRDKTIFATERWAGYRIKEVLSLKVKDICYLHSRDGTIVIRDHIYVKPKNMKGGKKPRIVWIHSELKKIYNRYLTRLIEQNKFDLNNYLFLSREGRNQPICYVQAWRIIKAAYKELDIHENVATHSLRKTFCNKIYESTGYDIIATMEIMNHTSPDTTLKYLSPNKEKLKQAVLSQ